ncbi:MAG: hypothetical protein AAF799_11205 [Myxococcota bacterium]
MLDGDRRLTQSHRVADPHLDGTGDSLTAGKKRSVRRTEILKDELAVSESKLGVPTGHLSIHEGDVTDIAADDDRLLVERLSFRGTSRVLDVQGV